MWNPLSDHLLPATLLALAASFTGTAAGVGSSTVMMPVLSLFVPVPTALLFTGVIHLCGNLWKVILFRKGFSARLVLGFGIPGIAAGFAGASLAGALPELPLKRILGIFLLGYVFFLLAKRNWTVPATTPVAAAGGALSGFLAGLFGVGGAVRAAFLSGFGLSPEAYLFTSGAIALCIDLSRVSRYFWLWSGSGAGLLLPLLAAVPASLAGSMLAKKFISRMPRERFRVLIAVFLALAALALLAA